jgi:hypothetical protein
MDLSILNLFQSGLPTAHDSGGKSSSATQDQTAGAGQKPQASNGHTVLSPQKQRTASRTQMDVKDYSVYHVDSAQQPAQQSLPSNGTDEVDDSQIRKFDTPPGKQQKGFLSKFFNREEQ